MPEDASSRYPKLLSPLSVGSYQVKNRFALTAHGEHLAIDGLITADFIRHYDDRAAGGAGLIVCGGSAAVSPDAANPKMANLSTSKNDNSLKILVDKVKVHDTLLICQASHRGVRESPSGLDAQHFAPSPGLSTPPYGAPQALTVTKINEIVDDYVAAAKRLANCGFDGIEITALGTHLIEQFWSPTLNHRDDAYGGNLENRMRFGQQVIQAVSRAVSSDFLIFFRMSGDAHSASVGLKPSDLHDIGCTIGNLEQINLIDISSGSGLSVAAHAATVPTDDFPESLNNNLAREIRRAVPVPVLVAGRILTPEAAEQALQLESADLIGMTRAIIADPNLPNLVRDGQHQHIRPCIAINEGCRRVTLDRSLACTVNPEVGAPPLVIKPAIFSKQILVVGAGPAGMEFARVAAQRHHDVTVIEATTKVGGQVRLGSTLPDRPHFSKHIAWLYNELKGRHVPVELGVAGTVSEIADRDPDLIVIATGCRAYVPSYFNKIPGLAVTDTDVFDGSVAVPPGSKVLVYDAEGHVRGPAVAYMTATAGADVHYKTPQPSVASKVEPPNKPAIMRRVRVANISVQCDIEIAENENDVVCRDVWTEIETSAPDDYDIIIVVGYRASSIDICSGLQTLRGDFQLIGDAKAPRLLRNAISEGARLAASV